MIKRYSFSQTCHVDDEPYEVFEDVEGDWVKWEDYEKQMEEIYKLAVEQKVLTDLLRKVKND